MRLSIGFVLDDAMALLAIFETIALGQLVLHPFSLYTGGSFASYQARMFRGLAPLSPILLALLLYAWLARLILKVGRKHSTGLDRFSRTLSEKVRGLDKPNPSQAKFILLHHPRLLLIVAMTAAVLLGLFPYWPGLNPDGNIVGTDTPLYIEWTRQMLGRPFPQAISYAFSAADSGFRPVPLIFFYLIASLGVRPEQVVEFSPVILGPLLSLASFIFVRTGSGDNGTAAIAALVTSFSFDVTVGIWAGYLANWLGMIIAFFFLAAFFLFEKSKRKTIVIPLILLSLALLLTHPWTWALILTTTFFFALTRRRDERMLLITSTIALIAVGVIVEFAKSQIAGGATLAGDLGTKGPVFGIPQVVMFWPNIFIALNVFYDGLLGNVLLLGLSALSFVKIRFHDKMEGMLACWIASASAPFALLNSFHQTRLIYDLPIPPLVAMGLLLLMSRAGGGNLRASLILLTALLFSANYALAAVVQA
ncbi:MAG: hypothetical protein AUJ08_06390 [Thaumarchaeota archaeon 13_1_40CM_3_50_5]|nr:MAG: hypothetical protein AUJ08_06390 [Thaumarchaeota archaeon 13_1_40CM_3_50_5]